MISFIKKYVDDGDDQAIKSDVLILFEIISKISVSSVEILFHSVFINYLVKYVDILAKTSQLATNISLNKF